MELREGYKKTEVGIIPNEWTPKTYGELFQFLTTSSFSRDELSEEGDVRCVHYGDIHTKYHQFLDFSNGFNSFIDLERGKKYPFVKDGDIIMADASEDYSGIGKSVEVKNLGDKLAISGLHTFLLRDKNGDFEDGFKAYIHSIAPVKKSMDRLATGLKVYGVSKANLKTVLVPVPPPAEQKAIATALSDVDTLITNLDKLIAKKKAVKQGAMQRLLKSPAQGGQRLPGFEGEWVEGCLGDFCSVITKGTTPTSLGKQFTETGIAFVKAESIAESGTLIQGKLAYIDEETNDLLERSKLKEGDLLFSIAGVLGRVGLIRSIDLPANTNQAVAIVRLNPNKNVDRNFIFQILRTTAIKKHIEAISVQGAQSNFSLKDVNEIPITIPFDKDEQTAIASILSDMTDEIESLERKKSKFLRIKQGMMQELLTGKTRLI